jgi:hypothetical protein
MQPIRIQRSRKHKQVSPNELEIVYVGRPTKYGNPFVVSEEMSREIAVKKFEQYIIENKIDVSSLKGKNLSCWCSLEKHCHADVLLKYANK